MALERIKYLDPNQEMSKDVLRDELEMIMKKYGGESDINIENIGYGYVTMPVIYLMISDGTGLDNLEDIEYYELPSNSKIMQMPEPSVMV